jgi:hypothetical protein
MAGFGKDDKAAFDKALTELQMKMYLTMCGKAFRSVQQEINNNAWASTVMTTTENFFEEIVFVEASKIPKQAAYDKIKAQIFRLNPTAQVKKIDKFIFG